MTSRAMARATFSSLALPTVIALLAGCSGSGATSPAPPASVSVAQRVGGTLQIGVPATLAANANARFAKSTRSPDYVGTGTKHAALFIDGATAAAGSTTSCSSSSCTISWSATLNVPATHTFAVEIDDAGHHPISGTTPYVLAEGSGAYPVVAGSGNALGALSLNGVPVDYILAPASCASNSCTATMYFIDSDFNVITYSGPSYTTPGNGQTPTTGQVYDNDGGGADPAIAKADSSIGRLTGTSQSPYTTYNSSQSTLTFNGVSATGVYTYTATCASGANGNFGIAVTGAATPSNDVTSAELAGLSPAVTYALFGGKPDGDVPNAFVCTNGQISAPAAASGTVPVS